MTRAQYERQRFWKIFDELLIQNGEPFEVLHEKGGEVTHWCVVNKTRALVSLCVSLDFLVRDNKARINVYIQNDVPLYNYLYSHKDEIEEKLGFKPIWNDKCNKAHTRRIEYTIPITSNDSEEYERIAETALPILYKFKTVFERYIPNLCDY